MSEHGVSLRHPNKRFQRMQADREERVFELLKNIWTVRKYFIENFGVDIPVLNGDQIPLHRNESSPQKTLNFTSLDTLRHKYIRQRKLFSFKRTNFGLQSSLQ